MPKPRIVGAVCAVFLLALFAGLSIWEMSGDSLTPDERAHLPAGYAYWVAGEFRLNPEHPPFVKLLCAAPLLLMDLKDLRCFIAATLFGRRFDDFKG